MQRGKINGFSVPLQNLYFALGWVQLKRLIEWHLLWKFACGSAPGGIHLNEFIHCWVNNTVDACHIHRVRRHRGYIMPKDDTHGLETVSNRHCFHGHANDSKHIETIFHAATMYRADTMTRIDTIGSALTQRPVSIQCPATPSNIFFIKLDFPDERSFFIKKKDEKSKLFNGNPCAL